jgi:hypothetical protein
MVSGASRMASTSEHTNTASSPAARNTSAARAAPQPKPPIRVTPGCRNSDDTMPAFIG